MNTLRVVKPGVLTTVQDLGRQQFQRFGVSISGAMDREALATANVLVGNLPDRPGLEIAWGGFEVQFEVAAMIAITGADLQPIADGIRVPTNRPIWCSRGLLLSFQYPRQGCYGYLSIAGGIAIDPVLKSCSTHVRSGLGGLGGRTLRTGDVLPTGSNSTAADSICTFLIGDSPETRRKRKINGFRAAPWFVEADSIPSAGRCTQLRVLRGRHLHWLDDASLRRFWESEFVVAVESDRMGYRLHGPELCFAQKSELPSAGVSQGTIQLPAGGNPIALMADAAPTGGYPNLAHIISVDQRRLAQTQPGQSIRFVEVSIDQARDALREHRLALRQLKTGIALRCRVGGCR